MSIVGSALPLVATEPSAGVRKIYSVEEITALLYEAGETQEARFVPGCWPAGYRSGMPEPLRDREDMRYAETVLRPAQPSAKAISLCDMVLDWINRLPASTSVEIRAKKIVLSRMRVNPNTGKPRFNWSTLGDMFGVSHTWAKTVWIRAVDEITAIANRPLQAACQSTMARIRAFQIANKFPPVPRHIDHRAGANNASRRIARPSSMPVAARHSGAFCRAA